MQLDAVELQAMPVSFMEARSMFCVPCHRALAFSSNICSVKMSDREERGAAG